MKLSKTCLSHAFAIAVVGVVALNVACRARSSADFLFDPAPVEPFPTGVAARHPKLLLTASGTLYLLAVTGPHENSQLSLSMSHNGGDSFMRPVKINEDGAIVRSHGENSPSLAFSGATLYALWEQNSPPGGVDLMVARSLDFGHSFHKPVRAIDKTKSSFNSFSTLAATPDGQVYVVWLDDREPKSETPGTFSLYLAKSQDGGKTFGKNIRVASNVCPCCRPRVEVGSQGEVFVAWRHVFEGNIRDMVVATSRDGGEIFAPPVRVAVDNWQINGCPDSGPALALNSQRLYVAWMTEGSGQRSEVRLSWSDDGGKSFAPALTASAPVLDANHPALSVSHDGRVLVVFQGRDPQERKGWSPLRPYMVEIRDDGKLSSPIAVHDGRESASYPVVAFGSVGRSFFAWTESNNEANRILLARGRKATR
ncbi:MAG: glycoside hydrolase [Acidobacteria bacterium]|nr:glycoside hydrolase [Acidobacteriota bacterium]